MIAKTKFNVNDLLVHKYSTESKEGRQGLEVLEVLTQTCMSGTQVFYSCRPIIAVKEFKERYNPEGEFKWTVHHGVSNRSDGAMGLQKYREDEVIALSKADVKIFKGK